MFVTNWISTTKIQKISEITNFFRHYFLSRTEVVYGARQYDDGEIYILCGQNQISWFDVRNIPNEIDLMTDEEWDNYDP